MPLFSYTAGKKTSMRPVSTFTDGLNEPLTESLDEAKLQVFNLWVVA